MTEITEFYCNGGEEFYMGKMKSISNKSNANTNTQIFAPSFINYYKSEICL